MQTGQIDPFTGELGPSHYSISTIEPHKAYHAKRFYSTKGWSPDKSEEILKDNFRISNEYKKKFTEELELLRKNEWNKLTLQEQELVETGFPVIFGLKPSKRKMTIKGAYEVTFEGGVTREEIGVIFVPNDKIDLVTTIVNDPNIKIEDISIIDSLSSP